MLRVALDELTLLSEKSPTTLIYGADIDGAAADWAAHLVSQGVPAANLCSSDFLAISPGRELPLVMAVVGNPPYVRHHRMSSQAHHQAAATAEAAGVRLSRRASLWAYFVIHACRFLKPSGRMAFLLPGAVLQADYASAVLGYVEHCFKNVLLVRVAERIFEDAAEETVILLAADRRRGSVTSNGNSCASHIAEVRNLGELERMLAVDEKLRSRVSRRPEIPGVACWKAETVQRECWELLVSLFKENSVGQLGDVAKVTLGTVTGANEFFLLRGDESIRLEIHEKTIPAVSRSAWLTGPLLSVESYSENSLGGRSRLLALPPDLVIDRRTKLGAYIKSGETQKLPDRRKCNRQPWWSLGQVRIPDAFLPYTVGYPRGMALNAVHAASTNTIHQVNWRSSPDEEIINSWVLSTWSVLGRLCAELFGRHYGGGVLKLELADAQRLPVLADLRVDLAPFVASARSGELARTTADFALLSSDLGLTSQDIALLQRNTEILAKKRIAAPRNAPPETSQPKAIKRRSTASGARKREIDLRPA
jgi:adenine-specific DNA-methyltransferase